MKKAWIIILILAIILIAVIFGMYIFTNSKNNTPNLNNNEKQLNKVSEKVTDECTDDWEELEESTSGLEANSSEEKTSPNCFITLKRYYTECKHTINEYIEIPEKLVNKTQKEIEEEYENWTTEKFSSTEIILYREFNSNCGQHFIVRDNNGKIAIYRINENNEEEVIEQTEISTQYLTENDKNELKNGIRVNGKEELNQLIEDFE